MSTVHQTTVPRLLREHVNRLRGLERSGALFIFVGTLGVDGVDDLLTPDSPPFENSFTNSLGDDAPVSFTLVNGWVHLRGGFTGGAPGTVIFTLPIGYRPAFQVSMILPSNNGASYSTVLVGTNGEVMYVSTV